MKKKVWGRAKELYITKHSYFKKSGVTHRYIFQLTRNRVTENLYSSNCLKEVVKFRNKFLREECPHLNLKRIKRSKTNKRGKK